MTVLIFSAVAISWGLVCAYFVWGFILRRMPQSLCIALACVYPVLLVMRELKWLPRFPTTVWIAAALSGGFLFILVILNFETQRERPFR